MKVSKDNENRIVRVRNEKWHRCIVYVQRLTKTNYQFVFETMLDYFSEGHLWGDYTEMKLVELVLLRKAIDEDE